MSGHREHQDLAVVAATAQWAPHESVLDLLVTDARAHLAGLLLRRITARVRRWYPDAAALRIDDDNEEGPDLLAVLAAAGAPLPAGSRDSADEDTPAWSEVAIDGLVDMIGEDLAWYMSLARPVTPGQMPLVGA